MWQKTFQQYEDEGFTVVGIALDAEGIAPAKRYYQRFGVTFPALVDPNYATGFGAVPKTFFVDEHGVVQPLKDWQQRLRPAAELREVSESVRKQWTDPTTRLDSAELARLTAQLRKQPRDLELAVDLASRYLDLQLPEEAAAVLKPIVAEYDARRVARSGENRQQQLLGQAWFQLARAAGTDRDEAVRCATLAFYLNPSVGYGKQIARIIAPEKFDGRPAGDFDNRFREATLKRLQAERKSWLEEPMTSSEQQDKSEARFPTRASVTHHTQMIGDREIAYRALVDWMPLRKIHKPVAQMFHTAYLLEAHAEHDAHARPLTFVFNGGPGAASAYLHMGAVGPHRVAFGSMGALPHPPVRVVDNLETWLTFTDLVFIDPPGTGFSRALRDDDQACSGEGAKSGAANSDTERTEENPEFWEIAKDLDALGEFISRFLSRHHRWTSPLFIAGESYGGFRVARMVRRLQEQHGVALCGALLISPAIEFEALWGTDYDLTYWIELFPSLAATAHHHKRTRLPDPATSVESVQRQAEAFANNQLARWLVQGEALPESELQQTVAQMSALCGLPESLLLRANGRITSTVFCRELLRDERRLCGRYDGSVTTVDPFPDRDEYAGPDPTLSSIDRLFTGGINHHLRANLGVDTELEYRLLSRDVNQAWKDEQRDHVFRKLAGAMDDLRYGMSLNEHMHVFLSHGRFDLVTPCGSSQRLIQLMKLTHDQREQLRVQNFDGGHMFYSWDESRAAFRRAAEEFYAEATGSGTE